MITKYLLENIEWIGTCIAIITSLIAVVQTKKANRIANELKTTHVKPIIICDGNVEMTDSCSEGEYVAYKQYTLQDELIKVGLKNIGETIITSVMIVNCKVISDIQPTIGDEINYSGVQEYLGIKKEIHRLWTHIKNKYKHITWAGDEYHLVICPKEVRDVLIGIANMEEFIKGWEYGRTMWELYFRIIMEVSDGSRYSEELLVRIKEQGKNKYQVIGNRVKVNFIK